MLLAGLCTSAAALGFDDVVRLHWLCLPFMHVGMVLGSLLAAFFAAERIHGMKSVMRELIPGVACTLVMILGMNLGSYVWLHTEFASQETTGMIFMLAAMMTGMIATMHVWFWLNQLPVHRRTKRALT